MQFSSFLFSYFFSFTACKQLIFFFFSRSFLFLEQFSFDVPILSFTIRHATFMNFSCALFHNLFFLSSFFVFSFTFFFLLLNHIFFERVVYFECTHWKVDALQSKHSSHALLIELALSLARKNHVFSFHLHRKKKSFTIENLELYNRRGSRSVTVCFVPTAGEEMFLYHMFSRYFSRRLMFWLSFMLRDDFFFREIFMDHKVLIENLFLVSFERLRKNLWSLTNLQNAL